MTAWKATTAAVHTAAGEPGGKIFVQFMHCGRVAHVANLPAGKGYTDYPALAA